MIALIVFALVTGRPPPGPPRDRAQPACSSSPSPATVIVLVTFVFTTLVDEPGTAVTLVIILLLSVALDVGWKRVRASSPQQPEWA